jgi:hypothetical protein
MTTEVEDCNVYGNCPLCLADGTTQRPLMRVETFSGLWMVCEKHKTKCQTEVYTPPEEEEILEGNLRHIAGYSLVELVE